MCRKALKYGYFALKKEYLGQKSKHTKWDIFIHTLFTLIAYYSKNKIIKQNCISVLFMGCG